MTSVTTGAFFNSSVFTPQAFNAMPPHMQTEALLLAVEFGMAPDVLAASIDLSTGATRAIMRSRHGHAVHSSSDAAGDDDMPAKTGLTNRLKILKIMRRLTGTDGIAHTSMPDISELIAMRPASVSRAVRDLITSGHLVCLSPGRPKKLAQYQVTAQGREFLQRGR